LETTTATASGNDSEELEVLQLETEADVRALAGEGPGACSAVECMANTGGRAGNAHVSTMAAACIQMDELTFVLNISSIAAATLLELLCRAGSSEEATGAAGGGDQDDEIYEEEDDSIPSHLAALGLASAEDSGLVVDVVPDSDTAGESSSLALGGLGGSSGSVF
jgi:hypothetical protein